MRQFHLLGGTAAIVLLSAAAAMAGTNPAVPVLTSPVATVLIPTTSSGDGEGAAQTVSVCVAPNGQLVFSLNGPPC